MQQQEAEVKKRLYRTLLATGVVLGVIFIGLTFFAPVIGSFFGLIAKIGKPRNEADTLAPPPPYFYNTPQATNQSQISLKGFSEPGSKVLLYVNGPETGSTIADSTGAFSLGDVKLIEGKNTIFARAADSDNNQSAKSQVLEIVYDTKKPKITVTEPKDKAIVRNLNQRVLVQGTLDEKCEVRINDRLAIIRPDNSFELLLGVAEGLVEIKVEATDEAGNKSDESFTITYVRSGV
ncbi:MAG: hypothetical protein ABIH84_02780 [bacterium]